MGLLQVLHRSYSATDDRTRVDMPGAMLQQTSEFMFSKWLVTHSCVLQSQDGRDSIHFRFPHTTGCALWLSREISAANYVSFLSRSATDGSWLGKYSICEYEKVASTVVPCQLEGDVGLTNIAQPWTCELGITEEIEAEFIQKLSYVMVFRSSAVGFCIHSPRTIP
jgi:hypothetical protein